MRCYIYDSDTDTYLGTIQVRYAINEGNRDKTYKHMLDIAEREYASEHNIDISTIYALTTKE